MSSSGAEPLLPAGRFAPHRREQPGAILGTNFANSACAIACLSMVHRWLIEPISGIEMGEQADKMKDILGRVYEYPLWAEWNRLVMRLLLFRQWGLLRPKEVLLCLTGTVSKICWRFCTGTLQRRLTRSHSIAGALSMAICQWDSKSTVWATRVSSLPWWKVLAEL